MTGRIPGSSKGRSMGGVRRRHVQGLRTLPVGRRPRADRADAGAGAPGDRRRRGGSASWSMRRQTALAVRCVPAPRRPRPAHQIDVRQAQLPLGIALEVYDAHGLSDAGTWQLVVRAASRRSATSSTSSRRGATCAAAEGPAVPRRSASGARFGTTAWSVPAGAVASDESLTEDRVLDSLMVPPPQPATGHPLNVGLHFAEAILIAAPTRAVERKWTRHAVVLEAAS